MLSFLVELVRSIGRRVLTLPQTLADGSAARPGRRDRLALDMAGLACLAGYLLLAWYSRGTWRAPELAGFFLLMGWVSLPVFAVFVLFRQRPQSLPVGRLLLWAWLFRLVGLAGVPLFEDDWFRYLWDGYRFAETGTPYGWAPAQSFADPGVPLVLQRLLDQINHPDLPTIYGPTTQLAFVLSYFVAPASLVPLQLMLIAVDLVLIRLLLGIAPAPHVLLYAWCPLVIKEIAFTAHPDGIGVCLALVALLFSVRGRNLLAAFSLGLAVGAKIFALLLLPFVLFPRQNRGAREAVGHNDASSSTQRVRPPPTANDALAAGRLAHAAASGRRPTLAEFVPTLAVAATTGPVFLLTLGALYAPLSFRGGSDLTSLVIFARDWEFNSALYALASAVLPAMAAKAVLGTVLAFAIGAYWYHWWTRAHTNRGVPPTYMAASGPLGSPLGHRAPALPRADWLFGGCLLVSPVINPWYGLWILPFAVIFPSVWAWVAASALLLSYITGANLGTLEIAPFAQPWWVRPVEFGLIFAALCVTWARRR